MIDILYLAFNRRAFTIASLAALKGNTDWGKVRRLVLYDDGSKDGTAELLEEVVMPCDTIRMKSNYGSPVSVMNYFIEELGPSDIFAKVDNDTMLPAGWLEDSLEAMGEGIDLLGIEARNIERPGAVEPAPYSRMGVPAEFIGGIGLMRSRAFQGRELPIADGRFGFTKWQERNPDINKAWLYPSLPVFLLDHLPVQPWESLSNVYRKNGWQRQPWGFYPPDASFLWDWWTGSSQLETSIESGTVCRIIQ